VLGDHGTQAPDGRTLAFAEWGDPDGFPVFSLHGTPGWGISEADRAQLARTEIHDVIREDVSESLRTGIWGWVDDMLAIVEPWGFDVGEIRVPTRVIYGLTDVLAPVQHGEWLARNVPDAEVVVEEELGHVGSPELVLERVGWLVQPV
jgi:pimeloyl-ACP methyl ester carboxylesterase